MAANIKINVDNKQAVQKVNEVITKVNEAKAAAGKPLDIGNQGVEKIKQAQKSLNGFKRIAVSGIGKQVTGAFAGIGKALLSPIGAAIVSVELLWKITKSFYDFCKGAEEARRMTLKENLQDQQKITKELEEQQKKDNEIIKTLSQLNSQQKLTNIQRQYAVQLAEQLAASYEGVNFQIDKQTGKIKNLNQQLLKIQQIQKEQQIKTMENEIQNAVELIKAEFGKEFNDIWSDDTDVFTDKVDDWWTKTLNKWDKYIHFTKPIQYDYQGSAMERSLPALRQMEVGTQNDLQARIKFLQKMGSVIEDKDKKEAWANMFRGPQAQLILDNIKKIRQLKDVNKEAQQAVGDLIGATDKQNSSFKKQKDALVQLEEWKKKTERDREFNNSPAQKQVDMLKKQIEEADKKLKELDAKKVAEADFQFELPWYQGQIKQLQQKIRDTISPEYKQVLSKQLTELTAKQKDAQAAMNQSEERERKIAEDILKITQERINKTNELADIQKKVAKAEQDFFGSQLKSIQSKVYEMNGKSVEYQLKQMKEKFKEQFKRDADENEQAAMKSLITTNIEYNKMQKSNPVPIESTITNELARKGGFASSVVVEDANSVNKRILEANEKQVSINEKMLGKVDKLDATIKQLGIIR